MRNTSRKRKETVLQSERNQEGSEKGSKMAKKKRERRGKGKRERQREEENREKGMGTKKKNNAMKGKVILAGKY